MTGASSSSVKKSRDLPCMDSHAKSRLRMANPSITRIPTSIWVEKLDAMKSPLHWSWNDILCRQTIQLIFEGIKLSMSPRPYRLGQRQVTTEQTRARILTAARELLTASDGFNGFSIDALARQAEVARMTVNSQFG